MAVLGRTNSAATRRRAGENSDQRVANRDVWDFGWEIIAHAAVSRRPPISLYTIVARTHMYTYDAKVWDLPSFKDPCRTQRYDSLTVAPLLEGRTWQPRCANCGNSKGSSHTPSPHCSTFHVRTICAARPAGGCEDPKGLSRHPRENWQGAQTGHAPRPIAARVWSPAQAIRNS
jgi:hypothetical protein